MIIWMKRLLVQWRAQREQEKWNDGFMWACEMHFLDFVPLNEIRKWPEAARDNDVFTEFDQGALDACKKLECLTEETING